MTNENAIIILKSYSKFLSGRGKKYTANIPNFNAEELILAMRHAAEHLSYRICPKDFIEISAAADATLNRGKEYLKKCKREKLSCDGEILARIGSLEPAVKNAVKVCRRLERRGSCK